MEVNLTAMRENIIEIVGFGMERERAELMADEILELVNHKKLILDFCLDLFYVDGESENETCERLVDDYLNKINLG